MVYLQRSYEGLAECLTKKGAAFYISGHVHDNLLHARKHAKTHYGNDTIIITDMIEVVSS